MVAIVAIIAVLLSACGGGSGSKKASDTVVMALSYRASTLDPQMGGQYDPQYTAPIFDTLIRWDKNGKPIPGLATKWEFDASAMSLTLTLRDGVKFQDGSDFNADAVKASLDRARDPKTTTATSMATVAAVDVIDPKTVKLTFSTPSAHMIYALGSTGGMIVSPASLASADIGTKPIGAGPYKVVSNTPDEIDYETWDGYWDKSNVKTPKLKIRAIVDDTARVNALTSGQIDLSNLRPSQIKQIESAGKKVSTGKSSLIYMALLNTSVPGLDKPEVRDALMNGIDRDAINTNLQAGKCEPTVQPFISGFPGHIDSLAKPDALKYDANKAKSELAAAGYTDSNPLKVEITSPNISVYQEIAEVLQDQYAKIGVSATVSAVDSAQATKNVLQGQFQVFVGPTTVTSPDPTTWLYGYYMLQTRPWVENYTVPNGKDLLAKARTETDPGKQDQAMQDLVKAADTAAPPVLPICAPQAVAGLGSGVSGFYTPLLGTYPLTSVTVAK